MIYLMWFDDSKTSLAGKIEAAARRYQDKFGQPANLCLVNAAQFSPVNLPGLEIKPAKNVLRNHFQVGVR
jgi:hypothetical protein